jgi:hypothetical protein
VLLALALAFSALAEVPAATPALAATPPALETPPEVQLTAAGDVYVRTPDGSLERIGHAAITTFEAHCDATVCDLVLRAADRRIAVGSRARADGDVIFARPVVRSDGRLGLVEPRRTGAWSAEVTRPPPPPAPEPPAPPVAPAPATPNPVPSASPPGDPLKRGSLPKEAIDAVIKANISQVRYCYNRGLENDSTLAGKVTIKFVIAASGAVSSATVKESTVPDPGVGSCITGRFMRMVFPPPEGEGIVIVSYPFVFAPG